MCELTDKIAELTIENDRIKKTSKQRFNQNKDLKRKARYLEIAISRFNCLKDFLVRHDFAIDWHAGQERIDFSLFSAMRGLIAKGKPRKTVNVDGLYAVKINGEYRLANIHHYICWQISFLDDQQKQDVVHNYNIDEFVLINFT